jgi:hypothetical protein
MDEVTPDSAETQDLLRQVRGLLAELVLEGSHLAYSVPRRTVWLLTG